MSREEMLYIASSAVGRLADRPPQCSMAGGGDGQVLLSLLYCTRFLSDSDPGGLASICTCQSPRGSPWRARPPTRTSSLLRDCTCLSFGHLAGCSLLSICLSVFLAYLIVRTSVSSVT